MHVHKSNSNILVQRHNFGRFASSNAPILSSNALQYMQEVERIGKLSWFISSMNCMTGMTSQSALDKAMYSASVVLGATNDCYLEALMMGHPT